MDLINPPTELSQKKLKKHLINYFEGVHHRLGGEPPSLYLSLPFPFKTNARVSGRIFFCALRAQRFLHASRTIFCKVRFVFSMRGEDGEILFRWFAKFQKFMMLDV